MTFFKSFLLAFILLFFLSLNTWAQSNDGAEFEFSTSKSPILKGETAFVEVNLDSKDNKILAIDLRLLYPEEKISIINLDTKNSSFEIEADEKITPGEITIVRGTTEAKSGISRIARIQVKATSDFNINELSYSPGSLAMDDNNQNILKGSQIVTREAVEIDSPEEKNSLWEKIKSWNIAFWDWLFGFFSSFSGN